MSQGPNIRKLIAHKMSLLLIPPGSSKDAMATGITGLMKPGNVSQIAREATAWVEAAVAAVKAAPANPYGEDEAIAAEILRQIEAKRKVR